MNMKTNLRIVITAFVTVIGLSLTSCGDSDIDDLRVDDFSTNTLYDDTTGTGSGGGSTGCPDCDNNQ